MLTSFRLINHMVVILIFVVFKIAYKYVDHDDLLFLTSPVNTLVCKVLGTTSIYQAGQGFFYSEFNIVIDKSCSGFNFLLIAFIVFYFQLTKQLKLPKKLIKSIILAMPLAFILTIFVNSSRILSSILIQSNFNNLKEYHSIIHESIGVLNNLTFLIIAYLIIEKLMSKKINHVQPIAS